MFLDSPLAWYHRTFGFGDYGRSTRPDNAYLFDARLLILPVARFVKRRSKAVGDDIARPGVTELAYPEVPVPALPSPWEFIHMPRIRGK